MNTFKLQKYDKLVGEVININLYDYQEHIRLLLIEHINNMFDYEEFLGKLMGSEFIHVITKILTKRCVCKIEGRTTIKIFYNIQRISINIFNLLNNTNIDEYLCRISFSLDTFIVIMSYFIINNLVYYGISTDKWKQPDYHTFMHMGCTNDEFVPVYNGGMDSVNNDELRDVLDMIYDENRENEINKKYNKTHKHNVKINNKTVNVKDCEDENCELCCECSCYCCDKCGYVVCKKCLDEITSRSGECPKCMDYPMNVNVIVKDNDLECNAT